MKTYDEIKHIITEQLGLRNLADYEKWCKDFHWTGSGPMALPKPPTQADIDLLNPDLIDNNAFWRIAEELFQTDPVSNCNGTTPFSIEEANRHNLRMYHMDGFTGLAEWAKLTWAGSQIPLLEIGPGYGAFKEWVEKLGGFDYYGADVYPRISGVDTNHPGGRLGDESRKRRYGLVIASNVFQHLSIRQRRDYYSDVEALLLPTGLFMVSMMFDDGRYSQHRAEDGYHYCKHYGQFTAIQKEEEILENLRVSGHFTIVRRTIHEERGWICVICQKREGPRHPFNQPAVSA